MSRKDQSQHGVGVYFDSKRKKRPYSAIVTLNKAPRLVGRFATAEEAREARRRFLADGDGVI